ncbi:MAG TPA: hypothetical protein VE441_17000 [Mycobacterium sp.]|nr:hypothetical protein [Mycobacterium sp.]
MTVTAARADTARSKAIVVALLESVREVVGRFAVTPAEYRAAVEWLAEAGRQDVLAGMLGFLLEPTIENIATGFSATPANPQGPYYVADAPVFASPCRLPGADDDAGTPLLFTGRVRSADGEPLPGAVLDLWHADSLGRYSNFHDGTQPFALRGRVIADGDGVFLVQTVKPVAYVFASEGPILDFLHALGRTEYRAAHLHAKLSHPGYRSLTTQVYFPGDPYEESELLGEAGAGLVAACRDQHDPGDGQHVRAELDFVLTREHG